MSLKYIPKKVLAKRILLFAALIVAFSSLIYAYNSNEEAIRHYKPYYLKSYYYALKYDYEHLILKKSTNTTTGNAKSIPVLVYHGVLAKPDKVSTSIDQFANEMIALKEAGYNTISLSDFNAFNQGKKTLPEKSFLLTFDDGRKDSYYPVDPILEALNFKAVMFVITGTIDTNTNTNNFHLTLPELTAMQNTGRWDLQAHTFDGHGLIQIDAKGTKGHFYSNKMWLSDKNRVETDAEFNSRITHDLVEAQIDMKNYFGKNAYAFAFPFNDYARDSLNFQGAQPIFYSRVKEIYKLLFYQAEPTRGFATNISGANNQLIRRINIETTWSPADLLKVLIDSREKNLPLDYQTFNSDQGWIRTKGVLFYDKNKLNLNADDFGNGGIALLNGTSSFHDYQETVNITWNKGADFSVLFNQRDIPNYYSATISQNELKISKIINDNDFDVYKKQIAFPNPHGNHTLGYRIIGDKLTVILDGQVILADFALNDSATNGGIGFEVWDNALKNAEVVINSLHIESAF